MILPAPRRNDNDTIWRPVEGFAGEFPEGEVGELLTASGSMTGALRARCHGLFRLHVVAEKSTGLDLYQHGDLHDERGFVREVLMGCGRAAWLFAQTLIPSATMSACAWLAELGERPLGDVLFARDDVERSDFLYARIEKGAPLGVRIDDVLPGGEPQPLWARRSYFYVGGHPLLVNEVFLPELSDN